MAEQTKCNNIQKQNVQYNAQKNAVVHYNTAKKTGNRLFLLNEKFFKKMLT